MATESNQRSEVPKLVEHARALLDRLIQTNTEEPSRTWEIVLELQLSLVELQRVCPPKIFNKKIEREA
jgi:hypothetical protein